MELLVAMDNAKGTGAAAEALGCARLRAHDRPPGRTHRAPEQRRRADSQARGSTQGALGVTWRPGREEEEGGLPALGRAEPAWGQDVQGPWKE